MAEKKTAPTPLREWLLYFLTTIMLHTKLNRLKRGADKSLARPGRKQATATEKFDVHIIIIGIQPLGRSGQRPELSQATGMALVRCILGKFLGVVCHCFPPMFIYPIYIHNWRNISTVYIYNKTSIKRNILTIKQNTSGSRSG